MTDKEILQAMNQVIQESETRMKQMMKEELEPINQRLNGMDQRLNSMDQKLSNIDERLEQVEESLDEVRTGTNSLLEWAEECSEVIKFPLPKVK